MEQRLNFKDLCQYKKHGRDYPNEDTKIYCQKCYRAIIYTSWIKVFGSKLKIGVSTSDHQYICPACEEINDFKLGVEWTTHNN